MIPLVSAVALAFANGANDSMKGVATLFGSGTTPYRRALGLAIAATLLGTFAALGVSRGLVERFGGRGLVPDAVCADPRFLGAVGLAAAGWVLAAARLGLPVSTTHALVGSLVGAGWISAPDDLRLATLGIHFLLPLAASPLLALAGTALLYPLLRRARIALRVGEETCLCVGEEVRVIAAGALAPGTPEAAVVAARLTATVDTPVRCVQRYRGRVLGIDAQAALDRGHLATAAAVCFARGANDAPKIAALLLAAPALSAPAGFALVAAAMALGGIFAARTVAENMGRRIAELNHGQGFAANLVSATLVIVASRWALPVSTTHVTCGALFGIGVSNGTARAGTILRIVLAWLVTLPGSALLAALSMRAMEALS